MNCIIDHTRVVIYIGASVPIIMFSLMYVLLAHLRIKELAKKVTNYTPIELLESKIKKYRDRTMMCRPTHIEVLKHLALVQLLKEIKEL